MKKKLVAILLMSTIIMSSLSGCGKTDDSEVAEEPITETTTETTTETATDTTEPLVVAYPLE